MILSSQLFIETQHKLSAITWQYSEPENSPPNTVDPIYDTSTNANNVLAIPYTQY
jgi:hypothetical protein